MELVSDTTQPPDPGDFGGVPPTLEGAVAALAAADPDRFYRAADSFDGIVTRLNGVLDEVRRHWNRLDEVWQGGSAKDRLSERRTRTDNVVVQVTDTLSTPSYSSRTREAGDALVRAQRQLKDIQQSTVQMDPLPTDMPAEDAAHANAARAEHAARVKDEQAAHVLHRLSADYNQTSATLRQLPEVTAADARVRANAPMTRVTQVGVTTASAPMSVLGAPANGVPLSPTGLAAPEQQEVTPYAGAPAAVAGAAPYGAVQQRMGVLGQPAASSQPVGDEKYGVNSVARPAGVGVVGGVGDRAGQPGQYGQSGEDGQWSTPGDVTVGLDAQAVQTVGHAPVVPAAPGAPVAPVAPVSNVPVGVEAGGRVPVAGIGVPGGVGTNVPRFPQPVNPVVPPVSNQSGDRPGNPPGHNPSPTNPSGGRPPAGQPPLNTLPPGSGPGSVPVQNPQFGQTPGGVTPPGALPPGKVTPGLPVLGATPGGIPPSGVVSPGSAVPPGAIPPGAVPPVPGGTPGSAVPGQPLGGAPLPGGTPGRLPVSTPGGVFGFDMGMGTPGVVTPGGSGDSRAPFMPMGGMGAGAGQQEEDRLRDAPYTESDSWSVAREGSAGVIGRD
ncbi:hypothetical protein C1701_26710 [Actinoalloteichus sp. AHMU CJ021]|uniref:PPE family protein n=1 Tax=Actinoalloteichus caeruleus DSM 43889 TaxID=1120930 RepID=A0ABT1JE55_ACTCY|nr:hypothetical protein [Actinoalloteichus caeruleus]AUS81316.1 hypothetical protein C1701_26710 [Actinoalloteichus sp. AHMU CJ021]MCP2330693.1 hypothetical protein [Actinoalloteichus caeruleus DSM 43889]